MSHQQSFEGEEGEDEGDASSAAWKYIDERHPRVASEANRALKFALKNSAKYACTVDDFWDTFRDFVRRFEYEKFVDDLVAQLSHDLKRAVFEDQYKEMCEEIRRDHDEDARREVAEQIKEEIQEQLAPKLYQEVRQQITEELRPKIEAELKAKLMEDPEFIAEAKADLQRKILGL